MKKTQLSRFNVYVGIILLIMASGFAAGQFCGLVQRCDAASYDTATPTGPYDVTTAEYQFPAEIDPDVLAQRPTELWARVYRPDDLSKGPYPVIVFLHGNHGTCGTGENPRVDDSILYTYAGTCPPGYVVTPNHAGYEYLGIPLASWGFIVVSVNANRGINGARGAPGDEGLNLARGRLILKHLQRWYEWNTLGGAPESLGIGGDGFVGRVDLNHVGLMGHSRGGEGARAAYRQYREADSPWQIRIPGLTITAIYEIGPVDGQTDLVLNAEGLAWNVLLPMCDGDVSNLQGVRPFDRMLLGKADSPLKPKSTYTVWGTNHNFFNTEWQETDSHLCIGHTPLFDPEEIGSESQRQTALDSVIPFFLSSVGPSPQVELNTLFNPSFPLPEEVVAVTPIDRGFTISPDTAATVILEDFSGATGTNTYGYLNDAQNIEICHAPVKNHDPSQRAARITWSSNTDMFFQTNCAETGTGYDIHSGFKTLDFRVSRQVRANVPNETSDFTIQLIHADATPSAPVQAETYTGLRGPVGGPGGFHPIMQTVRIPLADFQSPLTAVRGVRFTFDRTPNGAINLADIQLSRSDLPIDLTAARPVAVTSVQSQVNTSPGDMIAITLSSSRPFPVRNALPELRIGDQVFHLGGPGDADLNRMEFLLSPGQYQSLKEGDEVSLQFDADDNHGQRWGFGKFSRQRLQMEALP